MYQLHSTRRLLVLLCSGWSFAGQDLRYPSHVWLQRSA